MSFEIGGKFAIITGGATGIGYACAQELLRNCLGGVLIADINEKKGKEAETALNKQFGEKKAIFATCDVTQADKLEDIFKLAKSTFGKIDIVINNAGILNDASWEMEIAINCDGLVRSTFLAMKYMGTNKGGEGGIIVNLASVIGLEGSTATPIYVATKHFVVGFTRSLATDYYFSLTGIKFLTMCPGITDTPLINDAHKVVLQGFPGLEEITMKRHGFRNQLPSCVGRAMVYVIEYGENGSIWVAENEEPAYEVILPDRTMIRRVK